MNLQTFYAVDIFFARGHAVIRKISGAISNRVDGQDDIVFHEGTTQREDKNKTAREKCQQLDEKNVRVFDERIHGKIHGDITLATTRAVINRLEEREQIAVFVVCDDWRNRSARNQIVAINF